MWPSEITNKGKRKGVETEEKCGNEKKKKNKKIEKNVSVHICVCWSKVNEIRSRSLKKLLSSRLLAGKLVNTQIQDEVVLRSKPNFAKVAGALSCRIPFLPGEYRDRCFRVVEHPRCISLPLEFNFPPHFSPLFTSWSFDEDLYRISRGIKTRTLVFLEGEVDTQREREKESRKRASVRIRDRGISSSSKIGNQCGFTDGAFVRDRQLDKVYDVIRRGW